MCYDNQYRHGPVQTRMFAAISPWGNSSACSECEFSLFTVASNSGDYNSVSIIYSNSFQGEMQLLHAIHACNHVTLIAFDSIVFLHTNEQVFDHGRSTCIDRLSIDSAHAASMYTCTHL